MEIKFTHSPNFNKRPLNAIIDYVILHYTGMQNADVALNRMCDAKSEVSCHYMIDEDGAVYQLVADEARAWHAGVSNFAGRRNFNDFSIGIELVNKGHEFGYHPFSSPQIASLLEILHRLFAKYNMPKENIIGHSDIAPMRKQDPGEFFPWHILHQHNYGFLPVCPLSTDKASIINKIGDSSANIQEVRLLLHQFGYHIDIKRASLLYDEELQQILQSFAAHYAQKYFAEIENGRQITENIITTLKSCNISYRR